MSDMPQRKRGSTNVERNWNEEYDAWLELIEDHLKSIRRGQLVVAALILALVIVQGAPTAILLWHMARPFP